MLVLAWLAIVVVIVLGVLPQSAILTTYHFRKTLVAAVPEGYGFFTRDPQETRVLIYRWDGRKVTPANEADYRGFGFAGLSRKSSTRGLEMKVAMTAVPKDRWTPCKSAIEPCLRESLVPTKIVPAMSSRTLCGRFVLRQQKPVPWAWARSSHRIQMPSTIALVDYDCPQRIGRE